MSYITDNMADGELNTALANFNTVCAANSAVLGLTPADLLAISAASTGFNTSFNAATAAKASAKNSVSAKDLQRKASKAVVSKFAKLFRANQAVPDNLLEQLMLPHHKTNGSKTPPTRPINLVATPDAVALVTLMWNRNGNSSLTQFLIEASSDNVQWTIIGGTTKTKFTYKAEAGVQIAFRVTASRGGELSEASVPVVLWAGSGSSSLQLAA